MTWTSTQDTARTLGLAPRTLRDRAALPVDDPRHLRRSDGGLYWIDDGTPVVVGPLDATPTPRPDPNDSDPPYIYDEINRRYIFSLTCKAKAGRPFVVPETQIAAICDAYSRDGADATVNELCRTHGWARPTMIEVLKRLGKTHDSSPYTDEDIARRPEDELEEDMIRRKEERVKIKAERRDWSTKAALADEARHFDHFVARKMLEVIKAGGVTSPPRPPRLRLVQREAMAPFTAVYGLTDFHYGAKGWLDEVGQETTREILRDRLIDTTERLIERVLRFGTPARWLVPIGSDNLHADTDLGTTTKGTPLDTDGSFARMFLEFCALQTEMIDRLRMVAPVEGVPLPGNHDLVASMMFATYLAGIYRDAPDVKIGPPMQSRAYHLEGKSLIGFSHGDGIADAKLPGIMAAEAGVAWGQAQHRMIFTGHLHTDRSNEFAGCRVIHMPCLAGPDRWHHRHGFVGNTKALAAYLVCHEEGLVASLPVQPSTTRAVA